jgi:D-alanyl-D-alanine dipeptidase
MPLRRSLIVFSIISCACIPAVLAHGAVPADFIEIRTMDKTIKVEARYASDWNFMGRPVAGYAANKCYLTKKAASALSKVQKLLRKKNLGLLAFDCFRPARAVADFVAWTKNSKDSDMKPIFYPNEPKESLIERGYISDRSGHSRGSTIDLTIIDNQRLKPPAKAWPELQFREEKTDCRSQQNISSTGQLDMGTMFDCFSLRANTLNSEISSASKANRKILLDAMESSGFSNYEKEWWHFTLKDEPFKDAYFDFPIE